MLKTVHFWWYYLPNNSLEAVYSKYITNSSCHYYETPVDCVLSAVCCKLSRAVLSVCWPVQLSSLQLCQTVNSQLAPSCLFIALAKSFTTMVIAAETPDTPECLLVPFFFLILVLIIALVCGLLTFSLNKTYSLASGWIWLVRLYLWALWVTLKRGKTSAFVVLGPCAVIAFWVSSVIWKCCLILLPGSVHRLRLRTHKNRFL